jgi:hypothetical protein
LRKVIGLVFDLIKLKKIKMNFSYKYSLMLIIGFTCVLKASAIDVPQDVITGFSQGKAEMISKYFVSNVELTVDNKENIYSSTQADIILKDFFKKNTAQSFSIIHEGGKAESKYVIGSLKTSQGNYRITILLKQENNKTYIQQLRIEKDAV